jgi:hypothetical protein
VTTLLLATITMFAAVVLAVVAGMVDTMVITSQMWDQLPQDKGGPPQPASTARAAVSSSAQ